MFRRTLFAALVLSAGCNKAAPTPTSTASSSSAKEATSVAVPTTPAAPFEPGLPDAASLTASLDLAKMDVRAVLKLVAPTTREKLESALPALRDAQGAALLDSLGIDPARPITLAQTSLSDEERKAIEALRPKIPTSEPQGGANAAAPQGLSAALKAALDAVPALASYRVLFPAKDAGRVRKSLDSLLVSQGYRAAANGQYSGSHSIAVVGGEGDVVALDLVLGNAPQPGLAALWASVHKKHGVAPTLGQDTLRVAFVPEEVAALGFLTGVNTVVGATSGASIDPAQRERISNVGLWEAGRNLVAVTTPHGARYDRIELHVPADPSHQASSVHASPGPGFEGPKEDLWAPTFTVASSANADVSKPFLEAWKVPGGEGLTALDAAPFFRFVRSAGTSAMLATLPDMALIGSVALAGGELAPPRAVLERFARFGTVRASAAKTKPDAGVDAENVFFGILPDGATRADAECVLEGPAPCGGHKLSLGTAAKDGEVHMVLKEVEKHFVLLRTKDATALTLKLDAASAGPIHVATDLHEQPSLKPLDTLGRFTGTLRRDGHDVVVELLPQ